MLKFFRLPFATTGDKTAVPDAVDANGNVTYAQGYGFDYQRQKTDPAAKQIERDKMNQIFFDVTNAIAELQGQGVPDFITSALNGGTAYSYGQNAVVRYSGELYVSLVAANTALPSDTTKWALLPTPSRLQSALNTRAMAGGTADALTASFTPAITAYPAAPSTLSVMVRAATANLTTTPTISFDGLAAKTIVKGANQPLSAGDIAGAGHWLHLDYDPTLDKVVLQNPAVSAPPRQASLASVSASVAANELTLGVAADTREFRNATLTNGTPNTRTFGALSLVVPSGATLGTVSGQSARLILIEIDNAGTVELAVANLAGGLNLDETTLLSTTAISGAADSANVVYSTTARTNVPFRVAGFIDISEAAAGTWATAPTLVQGTGGQAMAALASFGYGQSGQDVTGSRSIGTTYYNTTGKPIFAHVSGTQTSGSGAAAVNFTINGVTYPGCMTYGNLSIFGANAFIPVGASYSVDIATLAGSYSGLSWKEIR